MVNVFKLLKIRVLEFINYILDSDPETRDLMDSELFLLIYNYSKEKNSCTKETFSIHCLILELVSLIANNDSLRERDVCGLVKICLAYFRYPKMTLLVIKALNKLSFSEYVLTLVTISENENFLNLVREFRRLFYNDLEVETHFSSILLNLLNEKITHKVIE